MQFNYCSIWLACFIAALTLLCGSLHAAHPSSTPDPVSTVPSLPLPDLLQRASAAFAAGDFATAADTFSQVESGFGSEPEWQSGTLPRKVLPLRGYAELKAGRPSDSIRSLRAWLERFTDDPATRSFCLYALACARQAAGDHAGSAETFATYEKENAGSDQAALAAAQRAECLFKINRSAEGIALLRALSTSAPSPTLRIQARLRALQQAVSSNDDPAARELLLGEPWSVETMPEIGILSCAAFELGDRWLAAGRAGDALRAYRFVLPRDELVSRQERHLAEMKRNFAACAPLATGAGAVWADYHRGLIARIEEQLAALRSAPDCTPALTLRMGQAFLAASRPREAWLCFEQLAMAPDTPEDIRLQGHYRWIVAALAVERWEDALGIARDFVARNPTSELAPEALFLIARAHLEQQRHAEACAVLGDLLDRFPGHALRDHFRFTRGFCLAVLEQNEAARADFDACIAESPDGPLAPHARLWHALTRFFERSHAEALSELDALVPAVGGHPLAPEVSYRRATVMRAMHEDEKALAVLNRFLSTWPTHGRAPEALVLKGDILMGLGRLDEALRTFATVPADLPRLFTYAAFQTGKILRARGEFDAMVRHFTAYAEGGGPDRQRVSEALYWVGWAHTRRKDPGAAFPVFTAALDRHGDDPQAGEISGILDALERLHRGFLRDSAATPSAGEHPLARAADFAAWADAERARALAGGRLTWFSRLSLWLAAFHARAGEPEKALELRREVALSVPPDSLDAAGLAEVGATLQEDGAAAEAKACFERMLDRFPESFDRGAAFLGLAQLEHAAGSPAAALKWIGRIERDTPSHPAAARGAVLAGTILLGLNRPDEAAERFKAAIKLRSARGRLHAESLRGLALAAIARKDPVQAIGYYQQIYTIYRACTDLVAEAYWESGRLFEGLGDSGAAYRTFAEYTADPRLADTSTFADACAARDRLAPAVEQRMKD